MVKGQKRNAWSLWKGKLKETGRLEDLNVNGSIIFRRILKK